MVVDVAVAKLAELVMLGGPLEKVVAGSLDQLISTETYKLAV